MNPIESLIDKLELFIRKYYKNRLIKGGIYSFFLLASFFLMLIFVESLGRFGLSGRKVLFYFYAAAGCLVLLFYILIPLFQLLKLGKRLSYDEAALLVGKHFKNVNDKVYNTLQLHRDTQHNTNNLSLIQASIDQRIKQFQPVNFSNAIDFRANKKHLPLLFIPVGVFVAVAVWNINLITDSANRILHYNDISLNNFNLIFEIEETQLQVIQQEDYELNITVKHKKGGPVPNDVYILVEGRKFKLKKNNNISFSHSFRNVQNDVNFQLFASEEYSKPYTLKTIPAPVLLDFEVSLAFPHYTGKKALRIKNTGDFTVPEGTTVTWSFNTKNTEQIRLHSKDTTIYLHPLGKNTFKYEQILKSNFPYALATANHFSPKSDSIDYFINVQKDAFPVINVKESVDSLQKFIRYYQGNVSDDYGFTKLTFSYKIEDKNEKGNWKTSALPLAGHFNKEQFFHYFDLGQLNLEPGQEVSYFFEIWDNDGVNGAKSSRTIPGFYKAPTLNELAAKANENNEAFKSDLNNSLKEANQLKNELKDIQKSLLEKENPDWKDRNRLENFLKKQNELSKKLDRLNENNIKSQQEQNEFLEKSEEILEKQELLNKLFDELMTDEMKKLYEELEKLLDQMDKNQILDKLENIEFNQEQILKELDKSLEQFKQLEFEQKLDDITNRLDELAKAEQKLAEETAEKKSDKTDLQEKQEEIQKEFDAIQKELEKLKELNDQLENKNNLLDTKPEEKAIENAMEQSKESLENNKNKKASEQQKDAAKKMEELSQMAKNMKNKNEEEKAGEDMQALRQLMENLLQFSFDQEAVMKGFHNLNPRDPKYVELGQVQRKLKDDARIIEDSLFALAKRVVQLERTITSEMANVNLNIEKALKEIGERKTPQVLGHQQEAMTSVNNLALLFDEALQQMQQQMKNKKPGSGSCKKPGSSGSPSSPNMSQMQKQMEKQLQKLKEALEKGEKPGGKKDGSKGDNGQKPGGEQGMGQGGNPKMSQELARMAMEQQMLRQQIQKLSEELNKDGSGNGNALKEIAKDLEKIEEEIVNKKISDQTLMRQKDIMTRLLEHDKAQREREYDNKRESKDVKNQLYSNPKEFLEYKLQKEKELELLKTIPPSLKPYYKNKVNEYFDHIDNK